MSYEQEINKTKFDIAIVGGGLSGILLALRLSREQKVPSKIVLIEQQPQLGGRLFFSSPLNFSNKTHNEINQEILSNSSEGKHLSGPGFEFMNVDSLNAILRHIQSHLSEDENYKFEEFLSRTGESESERRSRCFFVKKEFVSDTELLSGSSEILTKREAEILRSFTFDFYKPNDASLSDSSKDKNAIVFEKSSQWLELSKAAKETLSPIFSAIVGPNWEKSAFNHVCKSLWSFFSLHKKTLPSFFKRQIALELFLESLLRKRGINIRTLCEVLRVNHNKETKFNLILADEVNPFHKSLQCEKLIFAIPLVKCLGIIAKEHFSPEQSRFVSRVRPISLVVSEISDFLSVKSENWPDNAGSCDRLLFPVERAQGFLTQDGRILFCTQLDYEESLQAPAVREAVARLRRAAARVVKAEIADEIKKGARIPQNKVTERIVLLPIAYSIPNDIPANIEVKESKMGIKGLYCCGDSFPNLADEPWKMVVASVHDVVMRLNGESG